MAQESFAQAGNDVRLHIARDGRQALKFVRKLGEFRGAPRPRLILLELSLADIPGLRVLAELKADSDLMTITDVPGRRRPGPRRWLRRSGVSR
jgi:CheY-like chemotaxis protein